MRTDEAPRLLYLTFEGAADTTPNVSAVGLEPFAGASAYAYAGSGAPLGPHDSSEHYPPDQLPFVLRSVAENIYCECEPHVLEDMVRIITDAAAQLELLARINDNLSKATATGILGDLLNDDEKDVFVDFMKFLRAQKADEPTRLP